MTERVHYSNAPITEALIDLRVTHAPDFSVQDLGEIGATIADRYPIQEPMYFHTGQRSFQQPEDPMRVETAHQHGGFRFTSQNKHQILQARVDGFTFSTLAPYDRWEPFRDEARRLWDLYRSATKVEGVTRVEVRYINQLDLPTISPDSTVVQTDEYLRVYPEIPPDWPGGDTTSSYFMQLRMWQEDLRCWLIVNEAPVWPGEREFALFQLDFDFFREQFPVPWPADDDTQVWQYLEQLHVRKNEVFEASITDATRRLIR